jgi:hypothetical protein
MHLAGNCAVRLTQSWSQLTVQHEESISQIAAQQFPLRQPGRSCSMKQSPASCSPQELAQRSSALAAQSPSHEELQQLGSARQTASQQYGSSQ